jgi:hypothetical protein
VQASSVSDVSSVSVRDNDITTENAGSWDTGILIGGGQTVQHITVTGNAIGGAGTGVRFQGGTLQQTPICALNRVRADVTTPLAGLTTLPERAVVVAGAASRGGNDPGQGAGRVLMGAGNPNDNQLAETSETSTNAWTPSPARGCSSKKPTRPPVPAGHLNRHAGHNTRRPPDRTHRPYPVSVRTRAQFSRSER